MARDQDEQENLQVTCPCCSTRLTLDRGSGEILYEERPKRRGLSWDEAVQAGDSKQKQAEDMFQKGMARERNADSILEKKFQEALKRADKSDDPPPRIYDYD